MGFYLEHGPYESRRKRDGIHVFRAYQQSQHEAYTLELASAANPKHPYAVSFGTLVPKTMPGIGSGTRVLKWAAYGSFGKGAFFARVTERAQRPKRPAGERTSHHRRGHANNYEYSVAPYVYLCINEEIHK